MKMKMGLSLFEPGASVCVTHPCISNHQEKSWGAQYNFAWGAQQARR